MSGERDALRRFEEDLSAYLDGELPAARVAEIRAELARNPVLAARLEDLRAVDEELRAIPAPRVSGDLHAGLRSRIDRQGVAAAPRPAATPRPPRRRRRWLSPPAIAAAAVAAALALLMLLSRPLDELPEERIADAPPPAPSQPEPELAPAPLAVAPEHPDAPAPERIAEGPTPTPAPEATPALRPELDLDAASDEELAVAVEWELLEDLELLEQLDLLEAMVALEARGQG